MRPRPHPLQRRDLGDSLLNTLLDRGFPKSACGAG